MMDWRLLIIAIILGIILGLFIMMRRESKKAVVNLSEKEFVENMRKGQLVDLRKKEEFDQGHINGARNIPFVMLHVTQVNYVVTYQFTYIVKKVRYVNVRH